MRCLVLLRRRGEAGFLPASWDDALDLAARELRQVDPYRAAFYLTSRGTLDGPYSRDQIRAYLKTGLLARDTLYCRVGGDLWAGTSRGVVRRTRKGDFHYFAGQRWLPHISVGHRLSLLPDDLDKNQYRYPADPIFRGSRNVRIRGRIAEDL